MTHNYIQLTVDMYTTKLINIELNTTQYPEISWARDNNTIANSNIVRDSLEDELEDMYNEIY